MSALQELEGYADARQEHLTGEEQEAADALLLVKLQAALEESGADQDELQEALDELVLDALLEGACNRANRGEAGEAQFMESEERSSRINNEGVSAQLAALIEVYGNQGTVARVMGMLRSPGPRP